MPKQVVVIGLGRFGSSVARELYQMGHDVLAVDSDDKKVQEMLGQVTYAAKADATSEPVLRELGVTNYDIGIVAIGSDIQSSILATVLLKTLGIPFVLARARNQLHGNTLERVGADRVVYPEHDSGRRVARSEFSPGVIDYMEIVPKFGISKIRAPEYMVKRTLEEAGLGGPRDKYGIAVLAIRRGRDYILIPSKDEEIKPGDVLIVAGKDDQLVKLNTPSKEPLREREAEVGTSSPRRAG